MRQLVLKLLEGLEKYPNSETLRNAVNYISQVENNMNKTPPNAIWDTIQQHLHQLQKEGIWDNSPENAKLLEDIQQELTNTAFAAREAQSAGRNEPHDSNSPNAAERKRDISIVVPPTISTPLLPVSSVNATTLPVELVETLNHTFFLHLLATNSEKVLPPGKSFLSVMSQPHAQREHPPGEPPSLRDRVEDLVHKAFWDEAFESLSNPSPAVQLPRLKKLYEDMHIALKPLLPPDHPVLITLSSPLPPTPAPLRSSILHLREVLVCLRQRCAPARDTQIDSLIAKIDDLSSVASLEQQARLAVGAIQSILELSEAMKDDLSQFVLGTMGERQLREVLRTRAIDQEREIVSELWKSEAIQDSWTKWLSEAPTHATLDQQVSHRMWVYRLVHALGQTVPVSLPFPAPPLPSSSPSAQTEEQPLPSNIIPPPLFFVCSTLLYIQNYLQALVIAASLRSLVRLPPMRSSSPTSQPDPLGNFMTRIWTLLKAEIDVPDASETKLVNLADEVIRVRRLFGSGEAPSADEETRLRAAVDRTLQPRDPVFLLLQRRLLQAVAERLARSQERDAETAGTRLPESLQSGRERPGKRPRLMLQSDARDDHGGSMESSEPSLVIKGFEDGVLVEAVRECVGKLRGCVDWVEEGWGDVIMNSVHTHPASG